MDYFQRTQNFLVPLPLQAKMMDIKYFSTEYQANNKQDKELIDDLQKQMLQFQVGGVILSFAFILSVNRLLWVNPKSRWMKIPANFAIICIGQGLGALQGIEQCQGLVKPLQKTLTQELDIPFLKHMLLKYRTYPQLYKLQQENLFLGFMTLTEYQLWQEKNNIDFSII